MDDLICGKLDIRELAEWISQCDDLKHLEFNANCPFDILQKLNAKLVYLKTEVTLADKNLSLVRSFSNLRFIHIRLEEIIWDDPSQREKIFLEAVVKLEGLETLILENFSLELKVIAKELEKGQLKCLEYLAIPYISYFSTRYISSDVEYVSRIVRVLRSLRYLKFDDTYDVLGLIDNFIQSVSPPYPYITFLTSQL